MIMVVFPERLSCETCSAALNKYKIKNIKHAYTTPDGFTIFGEIFCVCDRFLCCCCLFVFNPTIEVFTFRLRRWCMLSAFSLSAFTHLWHECRDLLSPCDGMHVCTDHGSNHSDFHVGLFPIEGHTRDLKPGTPQTSSSWRSQSTRSRPLGR